MMGGTNGNALGTRRLGAATVAFTALVLVLSAWLQDDIFITLRVVDNFLNGHGPVWNVSERVQVSTHPLWLFLNAGLVAATGQSELMVLALSIGLTLLTVWLLIFRLAPSVTVGSVAVGALLLAKSFVDFAASGLEDPLTRLLLLAFVLAWRRPHDDGTVPVGGSRGGDTVFVQAIIATLATLNRPDALLLFVPALGVVLWTKRSWRPTAAMAAGFLPLLLWGAFAFWYFGSPFPNTAYAKLGLGVPRIGLVAQGLAYLLDSLMRDPATLVLIGLAVAVALRRPDAVDRPILAGGLCYLAYVVWIGGDYMSGRFLGLPLFAAVLSLLLRPWPPFERRLKVRAAALAFVLLVPRMVEPFVQLPTGLFGIADERRGYHPYTGLVYAVVLPDWPQSFWTLEGEGKVRIASAIGQVGFKAGPGVHIVDRFGIGDPLLARLPGIVEFPINRYNKVGWRPGHTSRSIPEGYLESLKSGENRIADPDLARFYDVIRIATRGPLDDGERWGVLWRLNLGGYDHLVEAYVERQVD